MNILEMSIVCATCSDFNCINHPSMKHYKDTGKIHNKKKAINCSFREINKIAENIVELQRYIYLEKLEEEEYEDETE